MSAALRRFGDRLAVAACAAGLSAALGLCAGTALAADYEVRLPVNKTVRMLPVSEAENATNAPTSSASSAAPASASPAPAAKPPVKASAKPSAKPSAKSAVKQARPAAKPAHLAEPSGGVHAGAESAKAEHEPKAKPSAARHAAAAPAEAATPQPAKKPAASKALAVEGSGKPGETISTGALGALPADGLWVGEVAVSIEKQSVVVRVDTNKKADHVTWFNQTEPRKLAIDLRGQWRSKSRERVLRFSAGPVKNLVVGQHEDRVRLSVEFRDAAVAPDITPQVEPQSAGLVVTIPLVTETKP